MTGHIDYDLTQQKLLLSMSLSDTAPEDETAGAQKPFTREELAMLEFARRWAPFGGVEAGDVLVEFGIGLSQFYARVERLLTRARVR